MDFTGKTVLVTGASRGIGEAIAQQFAQRGARVAVHYNRQQASAENVRDSLNGTGHMIVQGDLADPVGIAHMIEAVVAEFGRLDILVNNAAIYEEHPIADISYEAWQTAWQSIVGTNLIGIANTIYCAAQHMIKQGGGRIVNISSRGAFRGEPTAPAYGASRASLNSMGQSLAKALAPHNIFIGTVAPGFVETDMAQEFLEGPQGDFIRNESPLHRVAKPSEVAYVALFLASEGAEFTTGCIIDVNGASYLRT